MIWSKYVLLMISIFTCNSIFGNTSLVFPKIDTRNENKVFLIKDELHQLPIKDLSREIGVVQTNFVHQELFNVSLSKYVKTEKIDFERFKENINSFYSKFEKIILPIDMDEIENIPDQFFSDVFGEKIFLFVFSKQHINQIDFNGWQNSTIIFSNLNKNAVSNSVQAFFGGAPLYDINNKVVFEGNSRLGYGSTQTVGMDSIFLNEKIDSVIEFALREKAFPGVQILIAKKGKVVFHKSYGFHTYEKIRPTRLNDIYDLASVSKVTSALPVLMQFYGNDKFDLDASLRSYFPKFKRSNKKDLKMREILAHQAGLRPWIPYWQNTLKKNKTFKKRTLKNKYSKRYNVKITDDLFLHRKYKKRIYKAIKKSKVSEVKKYKYSGLAFYIFPEMVEKMTGMNYETYLKKTFYEPLGAHTITFNPTKHFQKENIIPTENDTFFRNIQIHGTVHDEGAAMMGGVSANAGLFASANDLAKLMQMYLNGGTYGGKRYIAEKAIKEFTRYQFPENENRRGLGFDKPLLEYHSTNSSVAKDASPNSFGHSGYTGTFVWVDPDHELIYIFLSNRVFPTRDNRKIYELNIRPTIHQIIYDSFLENKNQ